jgi:hypothetical protein
MDPQRKRTEEHAIENIVSSMRTQMLVLVNHGVELSTLGAAEVIAAQLIEKLPVANPWGDIVGPCYTSGALQRELGIGRSAVSKAVNELRLLRLVTSDNVNVYPAFQVHDGAVVRGLEKVLRALHAGFDSPWMWAQWLNTPVPRPDNGHVRRRIDDLIAGDVDGVVNEAEHTAAAWAA